MASYTWVHTQDTVPGTNRKLVHERIQEMHKAGNSPETIADALRNEFRLEVIVNYGPSKKVKGNQDQDQVQVRAQTQARKHLQRIVDLHSSGQPVADAIKEAEQFLSKK